LSSWWNGPPVSAAGGNAAAGEPLYEQHCAACHGLRGQGNGSAGKGLIPPPADLTAAKSRRKLDAVLANMIEHGKPGTEMAAWNGRLADREIADLVAYIRALGQAVR
jgi:high-affinity iron transporter